MDAVAQPIDQSKLSGQAARKSKSLPWKYDRTLKALRLIEQMPWPNSESPYARIARESLFDVGEWPVQEVKKSTSSAAAHKKSVVPDSLEAWIDQNNREIIGRPEE